MSALANLTDEALQECGLSGAKRRTLRAIVDHANVNPELLTEFANHDDDSIHKNLTQIKGIGPWTADMFLILAISRMGSVTDICPEFAESPGHDL